MRTALLCMLLALTGCAKKDGGASYQLDDLWVESSQFRFVVHRTFEGETEKKEAIERKVTPEQELAAKCEGQTSARQEIDSPGSGEEFKTVSHYCKDDKGIGHFATQGSDHRSSYVTKVELLQSTKIGQRWSAVHGEGAEKNKRSCVVETSRYCNDGVSTVCITERDTGGTIWLRQHYCKGQGWRGHEAVIIREGKVFTTHWSSDLVVDDVKREDVGAPNDLPDAKAVAEQWALMEKSK